jgi:hypothetical protein
MRGIASVLCSLKDEQYTSNNVNPWCLITEYPHNEGISFLISFGKAMQYLSTCQKICYEAQWIYGILYEGYCMFIEFF